MKTKLLFTFLLVSFLSFGQGTGEVIITEIHNRPAKPTQAQLDNAPTQPGYWSGTPDATPDEDHVEYFEIYNTTGSAVVMDGWTLTDASSSSNVTTIGSFTLAAGAYAVLSGYDLPDAQGGIQMDYIYDYKKPSLNNESSYSDPGDTSCPDGIIIKKGDGTLVDEVRYDYGYGEYIGNAGSSSSCSGNTAPTSIPASGSSSKTSFMLAVSPAAMTAAGNDDPANWSFSTLTYDGNQKGSPGVANDQDATLSVDDFLASNVKVYPNPASDFITVKSNTVQISSVNVYDVLGKNVISQTELTNDRVDISSLVGGIYFLKISSENATTTKKIIIE